jgi:type IV pilus assembly protein PilY1
MKCFQFNYHAKTLSYAFLGAALLTGANSYAAVSQSPLSLTVGVPPNMLLTLDDSGSMRFAFSPDGISGTSATRRAKSSSFNPLYYNPNVIYKAPAVFTTAGTERQLSTSFGQAWHNGFNTGAGSANLSGSNYRVTWDVPITNTPSNYNYTGNSSATNYSGTGIVNRLGENPQPDFQISVNMSSNGTVTRTNGSVTFSITRSTSGFLNREVSCSATASHASLNGTIAAPCTVNGSTLTASLVHSPIPAYYYVYNAGLANNCNTSNDACYALRFVNPNEQQNFANWYSFYRSRALATISAAALAFYGLSPSVRISWQALNRCTSFNGQDSNCGDNAFKAYSPSHKGQLYNWLQTMAFDSGTPLPEAMKRAGEFYKTPTPWQANPNGTGNNLQNTYACRASYHILMTDGVWNSTTNSPSNFRHDSASFTLPDGREFSRRSPYYDSTNNTLADLAMHYWATDLNPNLANNLTAYTPFKSGNSTTDYWDPRNDPAKWQHMTNFTMGLGLTQSLDEPNIPWAGSTFAGEGYKALQAGTASWPAAGPSAINANVYDLWHAAINSRGEFFSVDSPEAMVQAFADILSRIADRKSTAARPAINSGQVADEDVSSVSYQTSYASDDNWSGDVKRFEKRWDSSANAVVTTEVWSAKSNVPATRAIKIAGTGSGNNSGLVELDWNTANASSYSNATLRSYLSRNPETGNIDASGSERLNYIRGSRAGEGTVFRRRSSVLGDFYSSTPAVVSGARYLESVANKLENNTAYTTFKNTINNRKPRVYVGGNAGMLHGFNATTGVEDFAFIPSAVFPKLNKLTGNNYGHEFYVEGSPVVGDVYDSVAKQWRTILVGTLKAGGKSVFALDVTTPGSEKLLWQFDENSITAANAVKMGYSFSQPTIARLHTGKWAVVFGNGYESAGDTSGKAALYILDAMQGTLVKSLEVQGTSGVANGLSTPRLADMNGDGVADYAYAGDLQGNMWRFNLIRATQDKANPFKVTNNVSVDDFKVSYAGKPLFSATPTGGSSQRQAITSPPSLIRHPIGIGYLVVFGTGRFFDSGDKEGDKGMAQSVYGIWDRQTLGEAGTDPAITRTTLQRQTMTTGLTSTANGASRDARIVSNNTVRWQEQKDESGRTVAPQNGWYLDLTQSDGEMVVEGMSQLGNTLFFQSLVPNSDPCGDGASNWTYAVNPFTGGRTLHSSFDYVAIGDRLETNNVSAIRQDGEGGGTATQNPDGAFQFCTGQECVNIYPDPTSVGRQSWRRIEEQEPK